MTGECIKIAAQSLHIHQLMARTLRAIHQHQRGGIVPPGISNNLSYRVDGTQGIGDIGNSNHAVARAEQAVVGFVVGVVVTELDGTVVTVVGTVVGIVVGIVVPVVGNVVAVVGAVVTCITGSVGSFPAPGHNNRITTAKMKILPSTNSHPLGRRFAGSICSLSPRGVMQ
jgi:hypothetical protein